MLGLNSYPATQIAACRAEMQAVATTWRAVARHCDPKARVAAEAPVFNQMVVALEGWFVHRLRGLEGKDGNPMNELRLLALGVTTHNGWFPADPTIKWKPETSITTYAPGDKIALTEATFSRLATAYLDAVAAKFAET